MAEVRVSLGELRAQVEATYQEFQPYSFSPSLAFNENQYNCLLWLAWLVATVWTAYLLLCRLCELYGMSPKASCSSRCASLYSGVASTLRFPVCATPLYVAASTAAIPLLTDKSRPAAALAENSCQEFLQECLLTSESQLQYLVPVRLLTPFFGKDGLLHAYWATCYINQHVAWRSATVASPPPLFFPPATVHLAGAE